MRGRDWTFLRYLALQTPGWAVVGALAWAAVRWLDAPPWLAWLAVAAWVVKDLALYPFVRVAYASGDPSPAAALLGREGHAVERLDPTGYVRLGGELWRARLAPGAPAVGPGAPVRVVAVEGLTLVVEPVADEDGAGRNGTTSGMTSDPD